MENWPIYLKNLTLDRKRHMYICMYIKVEKQKSNISGWDGWVTRTDLHIDKY